MSDPLTRFFASRWGVILARAVIDVLAPLVQKLGHPPNVGICVACFERDIAGAPPRGSGPVHPPGERQPCIGLFIVGVSSFGPVLSAAT